MLEIDSIRYTVGDATILDGVSARFDAGSLSMIIGPNGSGKSTLMKIAAHEILPSSGDIRYGGRSLYTQDRADVARFRAALSQNVDLAFPLTVEEVVMMGRYPHFALKPSVNDRDICERAMGQAGVDRFRERNYLTLSGGERQMVQVARVLAQIWEAPATGSRYLLLDEPTSFLDINHQHHLLGILRSIAADNVAVVTVIHDVNLASQYADRIVALHNGKKVAEGAPSDVINPELFFLLYGMKGKMVRSDDLDFPMMIF